MYSHAVDVIDSYLIPPSLHLLDSSFDQKKNRLVRRMHSGMAYGCIEMNIMIQFDELLI